MTIDSYETTGEAGSLMTGALLGFDVGDLETWQLGLILTSNFKYELT